MGQERLTVEGLPGPFDGIPFLFGLDVFGFMNCIRTPRKVSLRIQVYKEHLHWAPQSVNVTCIRLLGSPGYFIGGPRKSLANHSKRLPEPGKYTPLNDIMQGLFSERFRADNVEP